MNQDRLKSFVDRIERLEEERQVLTTDIKDVYTEAKSDGFDVAILRKVIKLRKMDRQDREEMEELVKLYLDNL